MPKGTITIGPLDGRNGADPPISLPDNQAVEMLNVDRHDGLIGRKRGGADAVTETGGTAFSSGMQSLFRHVPGADETAAELWGIDGAGTPIVKRMTGGTSFANVTLDDAIATKPQDVVGASLNGKLYLAYDSTQDRLHCYDPSLGSARVRRVGIAPGSNAPTMANTGAGTWAAVLRYYRVRWWQMDGTRVVRKSEPTPSGSFTPSGTGTHTRITQPTVPGEGETHWSVEVSSDASTWYGGTRTAIATTTIDDNFALTAFTVSVEASGYFGLFPSVKYLLADGNRLLGAGAWESSGTTSGGKGSRVWFTPVLGSADLGDDERVPNQTTQKNWVDVNENDGGAITGMGGPIFGVPYAFKYRQAWKLNPTGDVSAPYLPRKIADGVYGAISHKTIVTAKDQQGNPALYFLGPEGPCRIVITEGRSTPQYLGRDVEDIWSTINLAASTVVAHGLYHPDKHQVWFWIATGSSNDPDTKIVFDVLLGRFTEGERVRGGWFKHTGNSAGARCSVLMSNTLAASMSRDLKPYIGRSSGTAIWKLDTSTTNDAGTNFQGYVTSKPLPIAQLGTKVGMGQSTLLAKAASGVTMTQTLDRDFGLETRTSSVLLTASASETRVVKKFEASEIAQADTVQVTLGDSAAADNAWTLDLWTAPVHTEGSK